MDALTVGEGNEGSARAGSCAEATGPHPMRRSSRVTWQIPVLLTSLDPNIVFRAQCKTLVVNLHGCGLRITSTLPRGTRVQLQVSGNVITGRVVDSVWYARDKKLWMLGIELDQPGNFWGIKDPPKDWGAFAEPAPAATSPSASDQISGRGCSAEKFAIWPSAFGPVVQDPAAQLLGEPQSSTLAENKTEQTVGDRGSGQSQQQSRDVMAAGLVRLQAEIERRVAAEWTRLRDEADQGAQESITQLRSELEQGRTAWREERTAVEAKIQDLSHLREQVEDRLNTFSEVLRRELAPVQAEIIDRIRQELNAVTGDFRENTSADAAAREQKMSAGLAKLEEIQNACARLAAEVQQRIDEDQAAREAINAQMAHIAQARTEEESLIRQHRTEQDAVQQTMREQLEQVRQARESVESLVHSLPEVIEKQVKEQLPAILQQVRDSIAQEVSTRVNSALEGVEKRLADILGDANHPVCQKLSDNLQSNQKQLLETAAAGITAEWTRSRNEAEQRVQESTNRLRAELEQGLTDWREERAGIEGKLQDLSGLREQIDVRLKTAGDVLRAELTPLRDQMIDQARQELRALITDFQEKAAAERTAREQTLSAALAKLEETQNACTRLTSEVQQRVEEERAAREAISSQMTRLLQARAEEELLVHQLQTEQKAIQQTIREQADQTSQAAQERVEALVRSLPDTIAAHVEQRTQAMLPQLREDLGRDVSPQVQSAVDGAQQRLKEMADKAVRDLRQKLSEEYEHHQVQFLEATAARVTELQKLELSVRRFASESAASIAVESEQAIAQGREQLQSLISEQQQRVEQASKDALAGLQTVAGNLLTSMRHGLLNDLKHEQEQVQQRVQTEIEETLRRAQQTVSAALQDQARQVLDGVRRELLSSFEERQQRFVTAHAAATAQLQQLEKRTEELTGIVDVELQSHTEETIKEAVAKITEELHKASSSVREAHVSSMHVELDRSLGPRLKQAGEAAAELRVTLDSLQERRKAGEAACAQLQHEVQEAQTWLGREREQFRQTIHDAFLKAAGEIRGRIHQAIEMASEPIESRTREIQAEIATLARQQSEKFNRQLDTALQRLQSACEESQATAERGLHERAAETLEHLQQNAHQLALSSIASWQSAFTETLAAVPGILAAKISAGKSTSASPQDERCLADDHSGDEDGGTQGA